MNKKVFYRFGVLCLILFLLGCNEDHLKEETTIPEVSITVVREKNEYAPCSLLLDPDYCRQLEEKLSIRLQIIEVSYTEPFREDVEITFTGGLVTSNCLWMIPKSSGYQLEKMNKSVGMKEPQYGRLGTIQYSYVFSDPYTNLDNPVLVANLDILDAAGVTSVDYSPEAFYQVLTGISSSCEVPLTVYGRPSEEGFEVLLGLYGLAPTGGREFNLVKDSFQFDKISEQAEDYLTYIRKLYEESLIPEDCIILNEYAARKLFLARRTAFAMFPGYANAEDVIRLAEQSGIRAAVIPVPVPEGKLDSGVYNRPIGLISFNYPCADQLVSGYEELEKACLEIGKDPSSPDIPKVHLFAEGADDSYVDPLKNLIPEVGTLYNKHLMDQLVISPYYTKFLTGALPIDSFPEMRAKWLNTYVQVSDNPDPELSGNSLLQIMNGWYYKSLRDK